MTKKKGRASSLLTLECEQATGAEKSKVRVSKPAVGSGTGSRPPASLKAKHPEMESGTSATGAHSSKVSGSVSEVPDVPPPPAPYAEATSDGDDARKPRGRRRPTHPRSFQWGPHMVYFRPPRTWQATCARKRAHMKFGLTNTLCTRTLQFKGEGRHSHKPTHHNCT